MTTTQRVDVARLSELLAKARHALANVDDSACRCNQYWKSRGLKDPGCNCDTYDDIAALSALIDSDALPALLQQLAEAERAREESVELMREVLERDRVRYLNGECVCINHSRKAEREYESGTCPHQRIAAFLAANGGA